MKLNVDPQVVKDAALDIWEDLSRTRLAGVAVGLGLALLAITAIVLWPHSGPEPTADATTTTATAALAPAEDEISFIVPGEEPLSMSDVELSAPRDPFRSPDGASDEQTLMAAGEEITDSVMSSGAGGVTTGGADGPTALMPLDDLSGSPAPTTPAEQTGGDGDDGAEDREPAEAPVTDYSYTADIQFGLVDNLKRFAHVQRLTLVPGRRNPLLMYLGVTAEDPDTAVFMVDSRLSQGGEGTCVPKDSLCTFLELSTRADKDEHHFRDAEGNEYLLRLRRLVRTTASAGSVGEDSALDGTPSLLDGTRE